EEGKPLADAALEAAKVRLRPILMTSFAFILGCVPLWRATGSGAISRQVMGTVVIGGMLASTAISIFIIIALFYVIERLGLLKTALTNNDDLAVAGTRAEQARQAAAKARSQYFPAIDYLSAITYGHNQFLSSPGSNSSGAQGFFLGVANATWEADVWGRIRR